MNPQLLTQEVSDRLDVVLHHLRRKVHDLIPVGQAKTLVAIAQEIPSPIKRIEFFTDAIDAIVSGSTAKLVQKKIYKRQPVPIKEFVTSPMYLDKEGEVYPEVLRELEQMNSPSYQEILLTGGIGSAKTTCAIYTTAYQLYLLSCMHSPHEEFNLDSSSEILFVFQSINSKIGKSSFDRFRSLIEASKYFQEYFPFDKNIASKMKFPHRIEVWPVSGAESAAIGQNVIGGLIDELNYMQITENSKQSVDGGTYDQAVALYNSIARRRKSRFMSGGSLPGKLCLVSSKRYPGQFTDHKEEEAKTNKTIYVYDKRVWEIKPEGSFSGKWFRVFTGTEDRKPRVIPPDEKIHVSEVGNIMSIPIEFKEDFDKDIINALREIAGVSTLARFPFFLNTEAVKSSFGQHKSVFSEESTDYQQYPLKVYPNRILHPHLPRYAHVDLAITGDSAGVAIGTVTGFKTMRELGYGDSDEVIPQIHLDGILEVKPPRNGEILFYKIRNTLIKLRDLGLPIKWVSFDSYQSRDSLQLLRQQGFATGLVSLDITTEGYDLTKTVVYSGSLFAPTHKKCQKEMVSLEKVAKSGKVDHPSSPGSSKDCSDAVAGVVYGCYNRREFWGMHKVPVIRRPEMKANMKDLAGNKE